MRRALFVLTILFSGVLLFAQEAPQASRGAVSTDYKLDAEGKIRQRISWTRVNAFFYEIEIEKITSGAVWQLEMKERTEQTFLELSLPPGMYRYRIHSYNVLGRVGATSEWTGIRVFVAKQPRAKTYSPASYFVDSLAGEFTLVVRGRDLAEEALIHLAAHEEGTKPFEALSITYSPDESEMRAVFSAGDFVLGGYDIVITNPGGMKQTLEGFSVGFTRPYDINISLGYAPILPLGGYLFDTDDSFLYPRSVYGRLSVVPMKRLWGWLGVELSPHYADMKTKNDKYDLSGRMTGLYAGALLQLWTDDYTAALNLRLGGGLTAISNIKFSHKDGSSSEDVGTMLLSINAGAAVHWPVWKVWFVEAGAEYVYLLSSQSPQPSFLRANIGFGRRFNPE
jgi:hypothetical protein